MKLAAMEAHYEGYEGVELIGVGIINPQKKSWDDGVQPVVGRIAFPKMLSFLGFSDFNAFVPGIRDIIEGGYELPDGETALSFDDVYKRQTMTPAPEELTSFETYRTVDIRCLLYTSSRVRWRWRWTGCWRRDVSRPSI